MTLFAPTYLAAPLGVSLATRFAGERNDFDYRRHVQHKRIDWTCSEPWSSIWVTSAGEVRTCCVNETSFGNLFERTIEQIWNGEEFRRFRAQHARHEVATGCGNCMANGRVRQSPFFRAVESVTYRPLFETLPAHQAIDNVVIEFPAAGSTVTDPIVVTGRRDESISAVDFELMIDNTPVANFNDCGYFNRSTFVLEVPVPFVSEGAHIVWARRRGTVAGWAYRQIFLWRSDYGDRARAAMHTIFSFPRRKAPKSA